ncbi:metallophosphoesterase [Clostridium chromiireducens]|uniref:metallophosphoesterase n=1 Tax=Clostridium chromiireducens TaxID=225345 RepID=UPI003AF83CEE
MIRWLHISDLHIREQADWSNYCKEIISKCKEIGEINLVIVTGDYHDFKEGTDFQNSILFLQDLIKSLNLDISQDLFVIPGNHDGVSEIECKEEFVYTAQYKPLEIQKRLNTLLGMFHDYEKFVNELIPNYPSEHPASVHIRTWRKKISLVHCNTAIGSDGKSKDNQLLDIDGLSALKITDKYPAILLAHNSFFDLHEKHQSRVKDFIRNNNIRAYLCGDKHIDDMKQITYENNQYKQIPCIVSYKSAPDTQDEYSRFGIIVGEWEHKEALLKAWEWKSGQGFSVDSTIFEKRIDMGIAENELLIAESELSIAVTASSKFRLLKDCNNWKLIDNELEKQKAKDISKSMQDFLEGYPCTWNIAFSDFPVKRQQVNDIVSKTKSGGVIALTGAGAEGKSTLLMQACVKLYREGYTVLYHIPRKDYSLPKNIPDNTILVIDDPDDDEFLTLLISAMNMKLTILFSARLNEWNLLCRRYNFPSHIKRSIVEIEVESISKRSEAEEFANCIEIFGNSHMDFEKLVNIFLHNADEFGFLYSAMLLAMHEKDKLEEVAKDIVSNIREKSEKSLLLLGYAVLFEHIHIKFSEKQYQHFLKLLNMKPREAKASLELELRLNGNRRETRHPKISELFYKQIFGYDGEFNDNESNIMRYNVIDSLLTMYNNLRYNIRERKFVIEDIISSMQLVNEAYDFEEIIQRLIEEFQDNDIVLQQLCSKLSNSEARNLFGVMCYEKRKFIPSILSMWIQANKDINGVGDYKEENSALWICREACINPQITAPNIWQLWAEIEKEKNGTGDYKEENSALWICREACINQKITAPSIWQMWVGLEKERNGTGDYEEKNSALWVCREACINQKITAPSIWQIWAKLEKERNGAGDYKEENSALWICREACINPQITIPNMWQRWVEIEKEMNGTGDYEEKNSALWICREACINQKTTHPSIWLIWVRLEKGRNGAGDYKEENSALWICREACINQKTTAPNIWQIWAEIERERNGAGDCKEENSTLWICREACINQKTTASNIWRIWIEIERERNGAGDYKEEHSALWICREACINPQIITPDIWKLWAKIERERNGAGDYKEENSALWICREACINQKITNPDIWQIWIDIEKERNGDGDYKTENSALWICQEACINQKIAAPNTWKEWLELAGEGDNSEDGWNCETIYMEGLKVTNREQLVSIAYANYLMRRGDFEGSRRIFRELYRRGKYISLYRLLWIETVAGNFTSENEFSIPQLLYKLESQAHTDLLGVQYGLWKYYCEQGNKEEANKYYLMIDWSSDYVKKYDQMASAFLQDCKNAYSAN